MLIACMQATVATMKKDNDLNTNKVTPEKYELHTPLVQMKLQTLNSCNTLNAYSKYAVTDVYL